MNHDLIDKLVNAVLYEGYILYPYRADSTKNRHRFTFGRVYPRAFSRSQGGAEPDTAQTQCLLETAGEPILNITARFLHPMNRIVGELPVPLTEWADHFVPDFRLVPELRVEDRLYQTWQEAVEQTVKIPPLWVSDLVAAPVEIPFSFPASRQIEPIRDAQDRVVGVFERWQHPLEGVVEIAAELLDDALFRLTVRIQNQTPLRFESPVQTEDEAVLMRTFISTHLILSVVDGAFISLLDPPDEYAKLAARCQNQGVYPVLVGDKGTYDTLLASPIILYDYPEIAPESPGDLFDGTEIDEILLLRIMSLTDDEKAAMRQVDERARQILRRTENIGADDLWRLHGKRREDQQ